MTTHQEHPYGADIAEVLIDADSLSARVTEMALAASERHRDTPGDVMLIGVLKGAVMFLTDFAKAMTIPTQMEFMAVSSYGSATSSSGVVRILKDLDRDIADRDVILVEDVIDSGLTLSWLLKNLRSRNPRSLEVVAMLRKPEAMQRTIECADIGFDLPNEFVVGYGLDYAERYRDLPFIGRLDCSVYT